MSIPVASATVAHFVAFGAGEKSAATAVFVFALLSTIALSLVLLCIAWIAGSTIFRRTPSENLTREAFFFRSQLGQYAGCLLLSNWISSIGGLIDIDWVRDGGITAAGSKCAAQGVLGQIGQFGSSFFIVAMGIHSFNSLVLRNRQPQWVGIVVTVIGWGGALIIGVGPLSISGPKTGPLYNIVDFTCGISKEYQVAHMLLYFLPLFLAALISAVVYSLIFLILRGTLTINGGLKIQLDPERRLRFRGESFEEYQRFISAVARSMLWFPITFILAMFPSSVVQLMDISGILVSSGAMAFAYILVHLDGVFNVLILFNVLRVLGPAVKPMPSAVSTDLEKGRSNHGSISRPAYDWTPQASFAPRTQGPVSRTAPPAHPPNSIPQGQGFGSGSRLSSLRRSPFQGHRKSSASTDSSSRLLTPEPSSRGHSPSPSLNSLDSVSTIGRPIAPASVLDAAELSAPPQAIQKSMQTVPQLHLLTAQASPIGPTGLTPSPRRKRAPLSTNLSPIPGSPAVPLSAAPPSAAPFHEVTLNTPAPQPSPTSDGVSSLISMYFSRKSASSAELPPFPTNAGSRDSTLDFTSTSASEVESLSAFPAVPVLTPPEAALRPLKATVSVGAVGGARGPMATPPPLPTPPPAPQALPSPGLSASSPSYYTTDASDYSESEAGSPPPLPSFPRAPTALQPTQPLRLSKVGPPMDAKPSTGLGPGVVGDDAVGAALERPPSRQLPERPRPGIERPASRALPVPPDAVPGLAGRWPVPPSVTGLHSRSRSLVTGQSHVSHSRQDSAASAHPGYL